MITGLTLGILTFAGMVFIFVKLPLIVKKFFLKHQLMTDFSASGLAWVLLSSISSSLPAAIASALVGIFVSLGLQWKGKNSYDR